MHLSCDDWKKLQEVQRLYGLAEFVLIAVIVTSQNPVD